MGEGADEGEYEGEGAHEGKGEGEGQKVPTSPAGCNPLRWWAHTTQRGGVAFGGSSRCGPARSSLSNRRDLLKNAVR